MATKNDWGYLAVLAKTCVTKQDWDGAKILYESQRENIPQMHFDRDLWESDSESHQLNKTTIYHQPTDTYFYVESLDEYMSKMKGRFLTYDIFNDMFIDYEGRNNQEKIVSIQY